MWSSIICRPQIRNAVAVDIGQEAANSDFLLEHGAAAKVNRVEDLPYRIEQLLGSRKLAQFEISSGLGLGSICVAGAVVLYGAVGWMAQRKLAAADSAYDRELLKRQGVFGCGC